MSTPAQPPIPAIELPPFLEGDHFYGLPEIQIRAADGSVPASPLVTAVMRFVPAAGPADSAFELTLAAGKITADLALWNLSVPEQAVPQLTAGRWVWRLTTTNAAGVRRTWARGSQTVEPSI
jgi:hypothetical protein